MGVVEKLKRLHKQTLLKLRGIKRVVIAEEAGVKSEEYLNRARTLNSYLNPNLEEEAVESKEVVANSGKSEPGKETASANGAIQGEENAKEPVAKAASARAKSKSNIKL